ncbi:uncharacterized protein EV422DRAFT_504629 [Fimicolochytrium jonesii]|uniref:uncharacterized protein n=1 Tax=Fimicolochytrium jonesii TaxID=1396493 RepID=UPI0022FE25CD|nr:uncharacterized protein EV422DRAFT_504629 [Fimicolochytrium jonesii]KAI8823423.1 hypothetical protein EV422DRAFT_504629 [Fimicolochytrium jonesii]
MTVPRHIAYQFMWAPVSNVQEVQGGLQCPVGTYEVQYDHVRTTRCPWWLGAPSSNPRQAFPQQLLPATSKKTEPAYPSASVTFSLASVPRWFFGTCPVMATTSTPNRHRNHAEYFGTKPAPPLFIDPETDERPPSIVFTHSLNYEKHKEYLDSYSQGRFKSTERQAVEAAMNKYMEDHDISKDDFFAILAQKRNHGNKTAEGVPADPKDATHGSKKVMREILKTSRLNRTIYQLAVFVKRTLIGHGDREVGEKRERRPYTPEEDRELVELVQRGEKWRDINIKLGRPNARRRYEDITNGRRADGAPSSMAGQKAAKPKKNNAQWTSEEQKRLTDAMNDVMEKKGYTNHSQITEWVEISKVVGSRDERACADHFLLRKPWFVLGKERWTAADDRELLTRILAIHDKAEHEDEIEWAGLRGEDWSNLPITFLRNRWRRCRKRVKDFDYMSFLEGVRLAHSLVEEKASRQAKGIIDDTHIDEVDNNPDNLPLEPASGFGLGLDFYDDDGNTQSIPASDGVDAVEGNKEGGDDEDEEWEEEEEEEMMTFTSLVPKPSMQNQTAAKEAAMASLAAMESLERGADMTSIVGVSVDELPESTDAQMTNSIQAQIAEGLDDLTEARSADVNDLTGKIPFKTKKSKKKTKVTDHESNQATASQAREDAPSTAPTAAVTSTSFSHKHSHKQKKRKASVSEQTAGVETARADANGGDGATKPKKKKKTKHAEGQNLDPKEAQKPISF